MNKILVAKLVFLAAVSTAVVSPADHPTAPRGHKQGAHFKENEIAPWINKLSGEIRKYRQECGDLTESSFSSFSRSLDNFDSTLQDLRRQLHSGFDGCLTQIRRVSRDFSSLEDSFQSSLGSHPDYRVRLGWYKIKIAYLELQYSLTGGDPLP